MSESSLRRTTLKLKTPNPLFQKWLMEWVEESKNSGNIAKSELLMNALDSLKKFPLILKTGEECMILQHFDRNLCVQLDRKLVSYNKVVEERKAFEEKGERVFPTAGPSENLLQKPQRLAKTKEKSPPLQSSHGSAAYSLLITLYKNENIPYYKGFMTKNELQKEAQSLSNTSLKRAQTGTFYSGWSSMSQLIKKGLVHKSNNPARYSLSEEGKRVADLLSRGESNSHLHPEENKTPTLGTSELNEILAPTSQRSKKQITAIPRDEGLEDNRLSQETENEDYVLPPGTFDIILLVDTAETSRSDCKTDQTISSLRATGIKFEIRHLKVGDYIWICRSQRTSAELVLPFIVERKRIDDLSNSIKDGRFHEQKFRLKKSGMHNVIYLIEDKKGQKFGLPITTLHQAINNTMISDEFTIKITSNHYASMLYLATVTAVLTNIFQNKVLFSCNESECSKDITEEAAFLLPFKTFMSGMGKARNFKTKEMFVKQLVQLHGLSPDKAWAITNLFATPAALISAFNVCDAPSDLLSKVEYGILKRKIGPVISGQLHQFYTKLNLK